MATQFRSGRAAWLTVLVLVVAAAALAMRGWDFYALDVAARVEHEDFRVLRPSGLVGHGYGIVGTLLIFANLLYLVRKRLPGLPVGSMQAWLNAHVFTGLLGSLLIVYHSAFQLRTPIATITAVSLGLVVLTGLLGRYLHAVAPQPDAQQLAANLIALDELIPGLGTDIREGLRGRKLPEPGGAGGLLRSFATIPAWLGEWRAQRRVVRSALSEKTRPRSLDLAELKSVEKIGRDTAAIASGFVRAHASGVLLRSWRGLHRFLAILMILSVTVHIAVAWIFGYRWLLSEP